MYLEFVYIVLDYFRTLDKKIVIYEIITPIIIAIIEVVILNSNCVSKFANQIISNIITIIGILLGFSITLTTILTTSSSRSIESIKKHYTDAKIGGKKITLFQVLLSNFTYSIIIESILLIVLVTYPIIIYNFNLSKLTKYIGFAIANGIFIHILLVNMRNLTNLYFILFKNEK